MAERRMFAKTVIDSDLFLEMPITSQLLYFHLSMRADDDGFINKPKSIMRLIGCKDDDMKVLITNQFVIPFESGVVVIKHWRVHNYIQKDRYKPTQYQTEKSKITLDESNVYNMDTDRIQNVSNVDTQVRLGKVRLGKDRLELEEEKEPCGSPSPENTKPAIRHKYGEYSNVLLSDRDMDKLKTEFPNDWAERIERLSSYMASTGKSYKNHLATIRNWARNDKNNNINTQTQNNQQTKDPYSIDNIRELFGGVE